jgi:hypothetical protein
MQLPAFYPDRKPSDRKGKPDPNAEERRHIANEAYLKVTGYPVSFSMGGWQQQGENVVKHHRNPSVLFFIPAIKTSLFLWKLNKT